MNIDPLSVLIGFGVGFMISFMSYFFMNAIYNEREKKMNQRLTRFMEDHKIK